MSSSSGNADLFNRLQLFRSRSGDLEDEEDSDDQRKRIDPSQSRVKRCLFGRGNSEENIKFAKRELEKSLADSKKRWNFDFEKERPMEGRYVWQTPPYPRIPKKATNEAENTENLMPSEQNPSSQSTTSNSEENLKFPAHTSSSDEQSCDPPEENLKFPAILKEPPSSSSSSSETGPGSPSQRSSSRPVKINQIFRQRKRSKSKVKVQERKTDQESNPESSNSSSAEAASASATTLDAN